MVEYRQNRVYRRSSGGYQLYIFYVETSPSTSTSTKQLPRYIVAVRLAAGMIMVINGDDINFS